MFLRPHSVPTILPCWTFVRAAVHLAAWGAWVAVAAAPAAVAQSERYYTIAFASFAPVDADMFLADADGGDARVFLPHLGFDGNASFSYDGAWIVFTSDRDGSYDIYRAHPDGTELERLIDDPAYDDQAALSPDGRRLAFVSSRGGQADIWIKDLVTGEVRNLTRNPAGDFRPAWSPDGRWIAFSSDRESPRPRSKSEFVLLQSTELYVVRPDGSELRQVTAAGAIAGSPSWSADGRRLVFYRAEVEEEDKIVAVRRLRGTTQIATIDLASSELRVLTGGVGEKWSPRFLPGERVGFAGGGPEGGVEFVGGAAGGRGEVCSPSWSTDGRRMAFHRDVDFHWPPLQRWSSPEPHFRLLRTGVFPAFAPSGSRLLCNDQPGAIVSKDIVAMAPDGAQRSVFFAGDGRSALAPVYSASGDMVAFALGRFFQMRLGAATADLAVVNADGTGLRILTEGDGNYGFPSWSPDGTQLVYRASTPQSRGLFVRTLASGVTRELTPSSGHDNFPAWSPRGDLIAFTRFDGGGYEIWTVKPDGLDAHALTAAPGNDAHCAWSPDGEWLAFSSSRQGFKDEAALHPGNAQPYGDIFVMRADGSDVRQLTDTPFEEGTVAWAPLAW
ncbi:MAG TPA: hypothetical protein VK178_14885 [Opitutaceae bacterium]|nr:hypothetical protein [Opitutaceae bacterium]